MYLEQSINTFLDHHCNPSQPVLLALSGGPDSLALLHLLIHCRRFRPLELAVAHVDHGWREESAEEAAQLQEMSQKLGLPFFLKTLTPASFKGNWEAESRQARLKFFYELCQSKNFQAVLMAHHADDQAETVLKRILEGACLGYLGGLRPIAQVDHLTIWRPLLAFPKKEIVSWLNKQGLQAFEDRTNLDPKFLRGRFRTRLIPYLSQEFGKEIAPGLERIGREAQELSCYWDAVLEKYWKKMHTGPWGQWIDLSQELPPHDLELTYLIKKLGQSNHCSLSRQGIAEAVHLVRANQANCQISMGEKVLYIDRRHLFLPFQKLRPWYGSVCIEQSPMSVGNWKWNVTEYAGEDEVKKGWQDVWAGKCEVKLPLGDYQLGPASLQAPYPSRSPLDKWWTKAKVPAFLRSLVPVVWQGKSMVHEFLSGRKKPQAPFESGIKLTLENVEFQ